MPPLPPHFDTPPWLFRTALVLMALLCVYAAGWCVIITASLTGTWTQPLFGIDFPSALASTDPVFIVRLYLGMALVLTGSLSSAFKRKVGPPLLGLAVLVHIGIWLDLTRSPYYTGDLETVVMIVELLVIGLLIPVIYRHH